MSKTCFLIIFFLAFVSLCSTAQDYIYGINFENSKYPYAKWNQETIAMANTCKDVGYMTEEEKKVIFLCNLARIDGKLFAQTFFQEYYDTNRLKTSDYTNSLFEDLHKVRKLPCLKPQKDLCRVAEEYTVKMGKSGKTGNKNYKSRYTKLAKIYSGITENYNYGSAEAIKIVMNMLIDDGNTGKSNRKNILSKKVDCSGVSIKTHSKYNYNAVMNFGKTK